MRGKVFGFVAVAIAGLALGAGIKVLTTLYPLVPNQPTQANISQTQTDSSTAANGGVPADNSVNQSTVPSGNSSSQVEQPRETKTIIPEAKTDEQEMVVQGMVDSISTKNHTIRFTQEIDDTSKKVNPRVTILKDAIVEINGNQSTFQQVMVGDYVTMILNSSHKARAIQIKR